MKIFVLTSCLVVVLLASLAQADISEKLADKSGTVKASDKSSDSKPKRDASFLVGSGYHGPSYKYLPPTHVASLYDSYASGHHGLGSSNSLGYAVSAAGLGHSSGHRHAAPSYSHHSGHGSGLSGGVKFSSGSHGFGGASFPASYAGGHGYSSSSYGHGHGHGLGGLSQAAGHGFGGGHGQIYSSGGRGSSGHAYIVSHSSSGHGHGHGFGSSGLDSSSLAHKVPSYTLSGGHVGSAAGLASGYHYGKGISGSSSSSGSAGFGGGYSSHGYADLDHQHHSDHVHNGNQEHHYVVSHEGGVGGGQSSSSGSAGYNYEAPSSSYLPPQHAIPSSSYGVPIGAIGASYSHSQGNSDEAPVYAAGHKGLGHFGYTASKPNALHTSFIGSSFKAPTYTKVPFKPSTFLGSKFEGSSINADGHSPNQQYLPPSSVGADSTGYDYPAPSGPTIVYREQAYQGSSDGGEPEGNYLPPKPIEESYSDINSAAPSASYLPPPGNTYGVPGH